MKELFWWGYRHKNGQVILKRFSTEEDLEEVDSSPFVVERTDKFEAGTREEAAKKLDTLLK